MDTTIKEIFYHYRQSPTHDLSLLQDEVEKAYAELIKKNSTLEAERNNLKSKVNMAVRGLKKLIGSLEL